MDVSQASLIPLSKALFSLTVTGSSLAAGVFRQPESESEQRPGSRIYCKSISATELEHAFNYLHLFIV